MKIIFTLNTPSAILWSIFPSGNVIEFICLLFITDPKSVAKNAGVIDDDEANHREWNGNEYLGTDGEEDGGYAGDENDDEDEEGGLAMNIYLLPRNL